MRYLLLILCLFPSIVLGQISKPGVNIQNNGSLIGRASTVNCDDTTISCTMTGDIVTLSTLSGLNPWTLASSNIYSSINDTVTVGYNNNTSLDTFTIQGGPTGGETINNNPTGIGGIDAYTILMLHLDNNTTDSEIVSSSKTVTNTNATFSSSVYEFGGFSVNFNGTNAYLSTPGTNDFNISSGAFTIDAWVNPTSMTNGMMIYQQIVAGNDANRIVFDLRSDDRLEFFALISSSTTFLLRTNTLTFNTGTWYHLQVSFDGATGHLFVNGVDEPLGSNTIGSIPNLGSDTVYIGASQGAFPTYDSGYIDEFRFSKGIARNISSFTPPISAYTNSTTNTTLSLAGSGTTNFYIQSNSLTDLLSMYNNSIDFFNADISGNPYFPLLTSNGILSTSGGNGKIGVTSTTGSGNVVLSTSPTLVTPIIGASVGTSLQLSSLTGLRPVFTDSSKNLISGSVGSGAPQTLSYQPGLLTAVNSTIGVYNKVSSSSTVDNIIGSAVTFSCVSNPTITMYECGTSTTCSSTPVTIGTVTVAASGTVYVGTINNSSITAGDYVGWAMTAGTCASIDISANSQIHTN